MMKCKKCGEEVVSAYKIGIGTAGKVAGFMEKIKPKDFICRKCRGYDKKRKKDGRGLNLQG